MLTTKTYDLLNRLTNISSVSTSSVVNFSYSCNAANQRTERRDVDSSFRLLQQRKRHGANHGNRDKSAKMTSNQNSPDKHPWSKAL